MSKRKAALLLVLGIVLGLTITACAGVVTGPTSAPLFGQPGIGPLVILPGIHIAPVQPVFATLRSVHMARATEQAIEQTMYMPPGHVCDRP